MTAKHIHPLLVSGMTAAPTMGICMTFMRRTVIARTTPVAVMAAGREQQGQSGNNSRQQNLFTHGLLLSRRVVSRKGAMTMPPVQDTKNIRFIESKEGFTGKIFSSKGTGMMEDCQKICQLQVSP